MCPGVSLNKNPSALNPARDWQMNVRSLMLRLFVTVLVEVAPEGLNEGGKKTGHLLSRCVCRGRTRCHPHPGTQLLGEHASTCALTCSCHQLFFFFLMCILQLQYGSVPSENKSNYKTTNVNIKF